MSLLNFSLDQHRPRVLTDPPASNNLARVIKEPFLLIASHLNSNTFYRTARENYTWFQWLNEFARQKIQELDLTLFRKLDNPKRNWAAVYCYKLRLLENFTLGICKIDLLQRVVYLQHSLTDQSSIPAHLMGIQTKHAYNFPNPIIEITNLEKGTIDLTYEITGTDGFSSPPDSRAHGLLWQLISSHLSAFEISSGQLIFSIATNEQSIEEVQETLSGHTVIQCNSKIFLHYPKQKVLKTLTPPPDYPKVISGFLKNRHSQNPKELTLLWVSASQEPFGGTLVTYPLDPPDGECVIPLESKQISMSARGSLFHLSGDYLLVKQEQEWILYHPNQEKRVGIKDFVILDNGILILYDQHLSFIGASTESLNFEQNIPQASFVYARAIGPNQAFLLSVDKDATKIKLWKWDQDLLFPLNEFPIPTTFYNVNRLNGYRFKYDEARLIFDASSYLMVLNFARTPAAITHKSIVYSSEHKLGRLPLPGQSYAFTPTKPAIPLTARFWSIAESWIFSSAKIFSNPYQ